jgi:hypothetical protein
MELALTVAAIVLYNRCVFDMMLPAIGEDGNVEECRPVLRWYCSEFARDRTNVVKLFFTLI